MTNGNGLERGVSFVLALCAVAIAVTFVYRQFAPGEAARPVGPRATLTFLQDWRDLLSSGRQVASSSAPVQVIEFIDLECPGCQAFAGTLNSLRDSFGERIGVTLIHFPLRMHRSARRAARAAECGVTEGKFDELVNAILKDRDSLSLNRWSLYGQQVGIRDTAAFRVCHSDTSTVAAIEQGLSAGERIGVRATPTVIVNGWRFSTTPLPSELRATIDALLKGKRPELAVD